MIGVFDSGVGGLFALAELRRLEPLADMVFFADVKNAPYGSKSREELIELVKADIERLASAGCDKALMACCTASTVYGFLPEEYRAAAVPIISPTARAAVEKSKNKKIGILSTVATQKSGAFVKEIKGFEPTALTVSLCAPELVSLAECGERDGSLSSYGCMTVEKCVSGFKDCGIDTLILGCTHFAYFEKKIKDFLRVEVVNSARIGALEMQKYAKSGSGACIYLN